MISSKQDKEILLISYFTILWLFVWILFIECLKQFLSKKNIFVFTMIYFFNNIFIYTLWMQLFNAKLYNRYNTTHKSKVILRLKKTANVRICVIDLSKVIMCYFHYGYTKFNYGNNSRLLFTDVDSWTYEIKTKDVYEDYSKDNEMLYFSN